MENITDFELIKKNTLPGLKFKSGTEFYVVVGWKNDEVMINYYGSQMPIPFSLILTVLKNENKELILKWKGRMQILHTLLPS